MEVRFFRRSDFGQRIQPPVEFQVDRYRHNMIGGPENAYLTAPTSADDWDYMRLLRAPVEIWDEGKCLWWGYVNRVTIPVGDAQRIGQGLDEMFNYVTVAYADGDTSAASDSVSIAEYGQKETRISNTNATLTEAEQSRGLYLADHQDPITEPEFSGGAGEISVQCYGWFSTLGWKYYSNATSSNVENTTQIAAILTDAGQFFVSSVVEDSAGITSDQQRDGTSTALTYINQLLNAGTSNVRPLLARVDKKRILHIYERKAKPPTNTPDYLIRSDNKLITPLGAVVPDKECKVAVWAKLQAAPKFAPMFIESAEYNAERDQTTYRFANSYEQIRLPKFIASILGGNSDGSNIGSLLSYPPEVPFHTHPPKACLQKYGSYLSNITAEQYLTINSTPASHLNPTYAGATYFDPTGNDDSGNPAWECLIAGVYDITVNIAVDDGTTNPTTGYWITYVLKKQAGIGGYTVLGYDGASVDGSGGAFEIPSSIATRKKFQAGDFLVVRINQGTDGDIIVSNVEMTATFVRATAST